MNRKWEWGIFPTKGSWAGCWYASGEGSSRDDALNEATAVMCDAWSEGDLDCPPEECQVMVKPEVCPLLVDVA